jgi:hypothetical protein
LGGFTTGFVDFVARGHVCVGIAGATTITKETTETAVAIAVAISCQIPATGP